MSDQPAVIQCPICKSIHRETPITGTSRSHIVALREREYALLQRGA